MKYTAEGARHGGYRVDPDRISLAMSAPLNSGDHSHFRNPGEWCVMEAVAYVAGEPWSDAPECACPAITQVLVGWNDGLDDDDRTRLLRPLIPEIVGTRGSAALEERRRWRLCDWTVHTFAPAWLDLADLRREASSLRALPAIAGPVAPDVLGLIKDTRRKAKVRCHAVGIEACSAAMGAAGVSDWSAEGADARVASMYAASRVAARVGVGSAASSAARVVLRPAVEALQASAVELIRELCAMRDPETS